MKCSVFAEIYYWILNEFVKPVLLHVFISHGPLQNLVLAAYGKKIY